MAEVQPYATVAQFLVHGLSRAKIPDVPDEEIEERIRARSSYADSKVGDRYDLPFPAGEWPLSLTLAVCWLVALDVLVTSVGIDPEGADKILVDRAQKAEDWLQGVAEGAPGYNPTPDDDPATPTPLAPPVIVAPATPWQDAANGKIRSGF